VKVLQLGKFYPPVKGGMETILALISERTAQHVRNRVLVANSRASTIEERHGSVEVLRSAALARIGAVAVCPKMPFELAREDADLIVLHEPNPMALVAYFLARPAGRLIVWYHSDVIRPSWRYRLFYRPFLRFALSRAVRIVVSSPTLGRSAPELQDFQAKCTVIPFGIEARTLEASDAILRRASAIRREISQPTVLFVGRLVPYKGVDVLLEALAGLNVCGLIVGDGPLRMTLEARARELDIAGRVKFLGSVVDDELAALYRACDVFVLPSVTRQEAFGVVQLEAMAAGKPVVSTDVGTGVGWVNRHGETGYVVPPRDAVALREALRRLLADPSLQKSMGDAAAKRVRSTFTLERMIDETLALYRDVMAMTGHGKTAA
jgi:glycosyltransferase involved in cell wall biosynthesis